MQTTYPNPFRPQLPSSPTPQVLVTEQDVRQYERNFEIHFGQLYGYPSNFFITPELPQIWDLRIKLEDANNVTLAWERGPNTDEVWAGYLEFDGLLGSEPWDAVEAQTQLVFTDELVIPKPAASPSKVLVMIHPYGAADDPVGTLVGGPVYRDTLTFLA